MFPRDARGRMLPSALLTSPELRAHFIQRLSDIGTVIYAAQEIGLSVSTLYRARRRFADFAAAWDAALELAPPAVRGTPLWSNAARAAFLEVIAEAGSPAQAALRAGQPLASAYRLRGASAEFAAAWDAAAEQAVDLIEASVKQRALHGTLTTVRRGDEVTETRVFSERLAIFVLKALRPATYDPGRKAVNADAMPALPRADLLARFRLLMQRHALPITEPLLLEAETEPLVTEESVARYADEAGW